MCGPTNCPSAKLVLAVFTNIAICVHNQQVFRALWHKKGSSILLCVVGGILCALICLCGFHPYTRKRAYFLKFWIIYSKLLKSFNMICQVMFTWKLYIIPLNTTFLSVLEDYSGVDDGGVVIGFHDKGM